MNFLIQASNDLTVKGVSVHISASYPENALPKTLSVSANGMYSQTQAQDGQPQTDGTYVTFNGEFNVEKLSFNAINASGVPVSFISELEAKVINTYDAIELKQQPAV